MSTDSISKQPPAHPSAVALAESGSGDATTTTQLDVSQWPTLCPHKDAREYAIISDPGGSYQVEGMNLFAGKYPVYNLTTNDGPVLCINLHCPTGTSQEENNHDTVVKAAQHLKTFDGPSIIAGDFNIYIKVDDISSAKPQLSKESFDKCARLANETDYVVVIPKGIVRTVRPANLFTNAQAFFKADQNFGDSMFVLVDKASFDPAALSGDDYIVFHPDHLEESIDTSVQIYEGFSDTFFSDHLPVVYNGMAFANLANVLHRRRGFVPSMFTEDPTPVQQQAFSTTLVHEIARFIENLNRTKVPAEIDTKSMSDMRISANDARDLQNCFWTDPEFRLHFLNSLEQFVDRLLASEAIAPLIAQLKKKITPKNLKKAFLGISQEDLTQLKAAENPTRELDLLYPKSIRHNGILAGILRKNNFNNVSNVVMGPFMLKSFSGFQLAVDPDQFASADDVVQYQLSQLQNKGKVELIVGCECTGVAKPPSGKK